MKPRVSIIAALGKDRTIGKNNQLLWHIPDDLKRFKALTLGHPVIMGRKTFDSIVASLGKALPGRTNIVITRDPAWSYEGAVVCYSFDEALQKAQELDHEEVFIGGGAQIYEQVFPHVDQLYLTLVDSEKEGDTFFPPYEKEFTKILSEEKHEYEGTSYRFIVLER